MQLRDFFVLPRINEGALRVWARNFLYFRKTWTVSLFWIVIEPVFYLGAIGFGLGAFVDNIGGLSYIEFFFPSLLATTAMMVSFVEGTYGSYTKLTHQNTYQTILLTRIGSDEIVAGEILWAATKGFFSVLGVTVVATFFGLVDTYKIIFIFPILFLVSLLFAAFAMVFTSLAKSYDSFIYSTSGLIVPMSLISGTYFPLEQLPTAIKYISYALPLTHAVAALRTILHGEASYSLLAHIVFLLVMAWIFVALSFSRIRRRLIK